MQSCPWGSRQPCTEKQILYSVVLILLEQHCIGKNLVQCCPRGSNQQYTWKNPANFILILLGEDCTGKKTFAMLSTRLQTTLLHMKSPSQCQLNTITLQQFLFWTGYNNQLLQILHQHCKRKILGQHWSKRQDCMEHLKWSQGPSQSAQE